MISVRKYQNKPVFVLNVSVFLFLHEASDIEKFKGRSHTFMTWMVVREGGQVKNGQNSDKWMVTRRRGRGSTEIGCTEL